MVLNQAFFLTFLYFNLLKIEIFYKSPGPLTMIFQTIRFMKMKFRALVGFAFLICCFFACEKKRLVEIKNNTGIVIERFQLIKQNGNELKDGYFQKYDESGNLIELSIFKNGKLNGIRKLYMNSKLQSEEFRLNDQFHGPYKAYFPNGNLQLEANYTNDVMTGDVKVYYVSGQLKEIVRFADSVEDGPFVEFYENGKLKAEGIYKQLEGPVEDGELKLYDTTGTLIKIMNCDLGKCSTKWLKDSTTLH